MRSKRITIYDLAKKLGVSPSYVSKALNNHPSISESVKTKVAQAATALNYTHNAHAAGLRQGTTKTIGVIVPHINQSFFSEAIAGIEEACFQNNHNLIIGQSHESFKQECKVIDTLIHQNVDCIIISVSAETKSASHLKTIGLHNIPLIQFDRHLEELKSYKVLNDNEDSSYRSVKSMVEAGYKKIAFLGGPAHLTTFGDRKKGYLRGLQEAKLKVRKDFVIDDVLAPEAATGAIRNLLRLKDRPDAFLTVSDHQSLAVLKIAASLGISVPDQLGIFGFANEAFAEIVQPTLSSVDQKSKDLGRHAANVYFKNILNNKQASVLQTEVLISEIVVRQSSKKGGG
jgi:DNA-binding LacI/PurR family transcriptional regulator